MNGNPIIILGIESSCDETAAAVYIGGNGILYPGKVLSSIIATQKVHERYGGVVPELASRAHQQNIIPVVNEALTAAGIKKENLSAIAFTKGPGLLGSLLVGVSFAKGFSLGLNIPLVEVNHLQGHVLSNFLGPASLSKASSNPSKAELNSIEWEKDNHTSSFSDVHRSCPSFPFLCLIVSGGHTQIVLVKDFLEMEIIGQTMDDAAGEAFDKTAKILGLPYPGGPLVDKFAQEGNPSAFRFPHPKIPGLNFSFSGLKTSVLYFVRDKMNEDGNFIKNNLQDLCASVQKTIIDILIEKLILAVTQYKIREIAIAGGVAANSGLRKSLLSTSKKFNWNVYIPEFHYCTDNAAMIAIAGYYKFLRNEFAGQTAGVSARM